VSTGDCVDDELLQEIVEKYCEVFSNDPYNQFAFYPSEGKPISASEFFGVQGYVRNEVLQTFDPEKYPTHPETGESVHLWMNPEVVFEKFREKFMNRNLLTLIRDHDSDSIQGVYFGYVETFSNLFEMEEWKNPFHYSGLEMSNHIRDFDSFYDDACRHASGVVDLSADTEFFATNSLFTLPECRQFENFMLLVKVFYENLANQIRNEIDLLTIGEVIEGSTAHAIFSSGGEVEMTDIFDAGHHLIIGRGDYGPEFFGKSKKDFMRMIIDFKKSRKNNQCYNS